MRFEQLQVARFLVASWALAEEDGLPSGDYVLDRALYRMSEDEVLPDWVASQLSFSKSDVGLVCVELNDILSRAQNDLLTEEPNPTYRTVRPKVNDRSAEQLLSKTTMQDPEGQRVAVKLDEARGFGRLLASYVKLEKTRLDVFRLSQSSS